MQTTLRQVGRSAMLTIPPAIFKELNLHIGEKLDISIKKNKIVIEPQKKPKYSLEELLAQCNPSDPMSEEDLAWTTSQAAGEELI